MSSSPGKPLTEAKEVPDIVRSFLQMLWTKIKPAIEGGHQTEPLILFRMKGDQANVGIVPCSELVNSHAGKSFITHIMEDAVKEDPIAVVVLVTEAWMAEMKGETSKEEILASLPIRDRPDRIECVLFNTMTKDEQFLGTARINRTDGIVLEPLMIFSTGYGEEDGTLVRKKEKPIVH